MAEYKMERGTSEKYIVYAVVQHSWARPNAIPTPWMRFRVSEPLDHCEAVSFFHKYAIDWSTYRYGKNPNKEEVTVAHIPVCYFLVRPISDLEWPAYAPLSTVRIEKRR